MKFFDKAVFLSVLLITSLEAHSQELELACTITGQSEAVALLLCENESAEESWVAAGQKACEGKETCNAWIWTDEAFLPDSAPDMDADLPKNLSAKAVAIWVSVAESLIKVSEVR